MLPKGIPARSRYSMADVFQLQSGANESDIAGIIAQLRSGDTLVLPANERIEIRDGLKIDLTGRDINIDLNGSTLHQAGNASVITASGTMSAGQSVSLDLGSQNAKLTFSGSIANLKVGDWIKVTADDVLPFDNRNTTEPTRLGQAMQIMSISGNTVEVAGKPLYADQYLTNVRAGEIVSGALKLANGTIQGDQSQPDWNADLVAIRNAVAPVVEHLTVKDGNSMGINLVNTVNAKVVDSVALNLLDDIPLGHYGYGVHSASSLNTTVIGLYAERVRHATDNNGVVSGVNDPNLSKYGADIGLTVKETVAYYSSAFSYSFHSEGRNGVLDNVMSFESHGFVGFRGVGHQVLNSGSVGDERGFQYMEYGYGDSRDTLVLNTIVREASRYVYVVTGDPSNNIIKDSSLEYDLRDGNLGTTQLINTPVIKWNGVDDNIINGTDGSDRLLGGRGVDALSGGAGDDYIWGGQGADTLTGGGGSDRFVFDQLDSKDQILDFQAGAGGDRIDVSILAARYGWRGDVIASGNIRFVQDGADTEVQVRPAADDGYSSIARLLNVSSATLATANIQTTISGGASPSGPPPATATVPTGSVGYAKGVKITGTTGIDLIDASHSVAGMQLPTINADTISTNAGDDYVDGLGGADNINLGAGNDTAVYYSGVVANYQGGSGRDVLILRGTDVIDLSNASDQSEGLGVVSGFDDVDGRGGSAPLTIFGNDANNNLWGGSGDDLIKGAAGNDQIDGGDGSDVVIYDGNRDDYSFIRINDSTWRVQDLRGTTPYRDYVRNVERVSFDDQTAFIETLNRSPTDILLSQTSVAENLPIGTIVGALAGVDPDVSEINSWLLLDDASGRFILNGNLIVTNATLDFEAQQTYGLKVQLTDSDGHLFVKDVAIGITDVNDTAPVLTSAANIAVNENTKNVVLLTATDADTTGENIAFSIDPDVGDGALFSIINGNQLQFINAPDFEDPSHGSRYQLSVASSDGVNRSSQLLTINVQDVRAGDVALGLIGNDVASYDLAGGRLLLNGTQLPLAAIGFDSLNLLTGSDRFEMIAPSVRVSGDQFGGVHFDTDADGISDFNVYQTEYIQITGSDIAFSSAIDASAISAIAGLNLQGSLGSDRLDARLAGVSVSIASGVGDDVIFGGSGADTLDGGAGADLMTGGMGDDIYVVDATGDTVVELAGQGRDTVRTSLVTYTLGNDVEDLIYTGTKAFVGAGNALSNMLQGGAGADRLDGMAGADLLRGGAGNDTYIVDDVNDTVVEFGGQGTDRVLAQISYTLSDNVENLQLTTSKALSGFGNSTSNTLLGNAGVNILDGKGGADTLTGGAGNDVFQFTRTEAHGDTISDFAGAGVAGGDRIEFRDYGSGVIAQVGSTDYYTVTADAAHGSTADTIHITGVFTLAPGDYLFL